MNVEQQAKLREAFPAAQIGKLPRLTCKACSDTPGKVCQQHSKQRCSDCGNYISTAHIHLDYVGHAATTDRLLGVDPEWTWEPMACDETGAPVLVRDGLLPDEKVGLWISLTVAGVTRPGFGGGKNVKEAIGDAIRNAAMRFGVALDLWSKEDLSADGEQGEPEPKREEGGLGDMPVPRSWAKVREWYERFGGEGAWPLAEAFHRAGMYHLYGVTESGSLSADQRKVLLQKAAGAVVWLSENPNTPFGPTPDVEHYQKAWAHVLEGAVLEVPDAPKTADDVPFGEEES